MMKNISSIFFLFFTMITLSTFAQKVVKGKVVDEQQQPLAGVNIIVKGTETGTQTDFNGNFSISASKGSTLTFSFLGFETQSIPIDAISSESTITLKESSQELEELVVVGYGTSRKKDVTGAVESISTKDFNKSTVLSSEQMIQGKLAGVQITSNDGGPASGQTIRIRGTGSLSLSSNPLIVIDGIPINDGGVGGSRNILNSINPQDIENITVLKDASSTAIFGSRAANGVLMITTKKGRANQKLKIKYDSSTSIAKVNKYVDVMDATTFRALINRIGTADQKALLGNENTNWQKEIYQIAITQNHNLGISGSYKWLPYRVSLGYSDADGVLKTDRFRRISSKITLNPSFLDNTLKVYSNTNISLIKNNFANTGAIGSAVGYDPTQPVMSKSKKYGGYNTWIDSNTGNQRANSPTNPLALLNLSNNTSTVKRFIGNLKLEYEIPTLSEFKVVLNAGYDYSKGTGESITSKDMPNSSDEYKGSKYVYTNIAHNKVLDIYTTYDNTFNDIHTISASAGYSFQSFEFNNTNTDEKYFVTEKTTKLENEDKNKNVLLSYFGRVNYNFDNRYLLTATLRADASSKLNPDNRWGYFPSVALAWNLTNESFLRDNEILSNLKLRLGYGQVGNVNGLGDYKFLTRYTKSTNTAMYQMGNSFYQTYRPEPINKNLRWEIANTVNVGIDYGFLYNRIKGSVNFYIRDTKDLISNSVVDPFTNFGNKVDQNIGNMRNKGVEFSIDAVVLKTEDFTWDINYNISYNQNKITKMPDAIDTGGIGGGTGNTIQRHKEGQSASSFYVYQQVYDDNDNPIEGVFVDRNKDGQINDDDRYYFHKPDADVIMGFSTNLSYKNMDFSIVSRANIGNYVYNNVDATLSHETRATENNVLSNLSNDYRDGKQFKNMTDKSLLSDYYIQDASFFRIDNISLGYKLPKAWTKFVSLRLYATAKNVLVVTKYKGIDPEIRGGIDNNFYPRPQTFLTGIQVNF